MKVTLEEKRKFYKLLSFYTNSNLDMITSLKLIDNEIKYIDVKGILHSIENGEEISLVFEKYKIADEFIKANLKIGEESGNYSKIYNVLAEYLDKKIYTISCVKRIFLYPIILLCLMIALIVFIVMFASPQLYKLYQNMDISPPGLMESIIKINKFFAANSIFIRSIIITGVLIGIIGSRRTVFTEKIKKLFLKQRWIRKIYVNYYIREISWQLYNLMESKLDIIQAFQIINLNLNNLKIYKFVSDILSSLENGEKLSSFCDKNIMILGNVIPVYIRIGEESGNIVDNIKYINTYSNRKFVDTVDLINRLLPPALILLMGIFMGLILLVVLPLLDVSNVCSGI